MLVQIKHQIDPCAEAEGLKQRLVHQLSPQAASLATEWLIGDCIATYWRPHFEAQTYPYLPVHITRPKETRKLFTVYLPERCYFAVSILQLQCVQFSGGSLCKASYHTCFLQKGCTCYLVHSGFIRKPCWYENKLSRISCNAGEQCILHASS